MVLVCLPQHGTGHGDLCDWTCIFLQTYFDCWMRHGHSFGVDVYFRILHDDPRSGPAAYPVAAEGRGQG